MNRSHLYLLVVASILQMVDGFDLLAMSLAATSVAHDWSLSPASLGIVFSAAHLGGLAAAAASPKLARYFGRKTLVIGAALVVSAGSALSAIAWNIEFLMAARLLTGLGLGVVAPTIIGYAAEFFPLGTRGLAIAIISSVLFSGYVIGGLAAVFLIPAFGWPSIFVIGAVMPVLLVPFMLRFPKSPIELLRKGKPAAEIDAICKRYDIPFPQEEETTRASGRDFFAVRQAFTMHRGHELITALITIACGGLLVFFLTSWLPALVERGGLSREESFIASSALSIGALFGNIMSGKLMDRFSPHGVLGVMFLCGSVSLLIVTVAPATSTALLPLFALVGFFAMGAVPGTLTFCTLVFPSAIRLEIIALVTVTSRTAGLIAPTAAGVILGAGGTGNQLFEVAACVALVGSIAAIGAGVVAYLTGRPVRVPH